MDGHGMKISEAKFAGSSITVQGKPKERFPEVAFIGRSNVGKSSLINMLCGKRKLAMTSSTPGKTKVVNHFLINGNWYLVDLPGYGFAKMAQKEREKLHGIISNYLTYSEELKFIFVLVDSRHDPQKVDMDFMNELIDNEIPFGIIFTKSDKMGPVAGEQKVAAYQNKLLESWVGLPPCFISSATSGKGKEEILDFIESILKD